MDKQQDLSFFTMRVSVKFKDDTMIVNSKNIVDMDDTELCRSIFEIREAYADIALSSDRIKEIDDRIQQAVRAREKVNNSIVKETDGVKKQISNEVAYKNNLVMPESFKEQFSLLQDQAISLPISKEKDLLESFKGIRATMAAKKEKEHLDRATKGFVYADECSDFAASEITRVLDRVGYINKLIAEASALYDASRQEDNFDDEESRLEEYLMNFFLVNRKDSTKEYFYTAHNYMRASRVADIARRCGFKVDAERDVNHITLKIKMNVEVYKPKHKKLDELIEVIQNELYSGSILYCRIPNKNGWFVILNKALRHIFLEDIVIAKDEGLPDDALSSFRELPPTVEYVYLLRSRHDRDYKI